MTWATQARVLHRSLKKIPKTFISSIPLKKAHWLHSRDATIEGSSRNLWHWKAMIPAFSIAAPIKQNSSTFSSIIWHLKLQKRYKIHFPSENGKRPENRFHKAFLRSESDRSTRIDSSHENWNPWCWRDVIRVSLLRKKELCRITQLLYRKKFVVTRSRLTGKLKISWKKIALGVDLNIERKPPT